MHTFPHIQTLCRRANDCKFRYVQVHFMKTIYDMMCEYTRMLEF